MSLPEAWRPPSSSLAATGRLLAISLQPFRRAPATAGLLWAAAVVTSFVLERGAAQQLQVIAGHRGVHPRLALLVVSTLLGWASDCVLQALWARLAWQVRRGGPTQLRVLWHQLRGAWTSVGVMVAYASLAAAALGWPAMVGALRGISHPRAAAAATFVAVALLAYGGVRTLLSVPAAAAEQLGSRAAWAASWRLSEGRAAQLALWMLLPSAAGLVVGKGVAAVWPSGPASATWPALLGGSAQALFAGVPATLYWAWRTEQAGQAGQAA